MNNIENPNNQRLLKYLSPVAVWALSFGCAVGWGAFVMPGTTFLPKAGPLGTVLGIVLGALIMCFIGLNYSYLMNKYPDAGGTLTYTIKTLGYDHGFMSSWFLILVYIAIIWANATAIGLISKNLFGSTFQFGFHYHVLDYDVYFGEVLLSVVAILLCGTVCIFHKRLAALIQIIFAFLLVIGVVVCAVVVFSNIKDAGTYHIPAFSPSKDSKILQVSTLIALSPWAFVGFESVSNSAAGFKFQHKRIFCILVLSIIAGTLVYCLLTFMAVSFVPSDYNSWVEYVNDLENHSGIEGLPTFYAAYSAMGKSGVVILGLAAMAGIATGLIGNLVAASRLLYTMANEGILPKWFGKLNKKHSPQNALIFLMCISVIIPLFGRTAIGWIVDVNTIGAIIAYSYTSFCAIMAAKNDNNRLIKISGSIGLISSIIFFVYFMSWTAGALSTESYLILTFWSILGFVYFRFVFERDKDRKFGKSTIVWLALLFLIFFTSLMWVKQSTDEITEEIAHNISTYYEKQNLTDDNEFIEETEAYLNNQLQKADKKITMNSVIQMLLIMASLSIMVSVYNMMTKREKAAEAERTRAEESSKAKTVFLSNMSHDIRTPMNAIIGYTNLADKEDITLEELKEYLAKIKGSSQHLLALINDVLEMSRIESGKMDIEPIPMDLCKVLEEVKDMFATQMAEKDIDYIVNYQGIKNKYVLCDKNRLNRILLNLVSNAYKFTPSGGSVEVIAWELEGAEENASTYELHIKDSGMGMSEEFAEKIFEPFEREKNSTVSGIQGTGLGMSITKSIVDLMGGKITLKTAPGAGSEFIICLNLQLLPSEALQNPAEKKTVSESKNIDYSKYRILLVDDMMVNREIASKILQKIGFSVEQAENGKDAFDKYTASTPGYFDAILMDVQMPVMDGFTATELIRNMEDTRYSNIPIIAVTANAFSEDVKKTLDAGMNGHVSKPIDIKQLVNVLNEFLT